MRGSVVPRWHVAHFDLHGRVTAFVERRQMRAVDGAHHLDHEARSALRRLVIRREFVR